MTLTLVSTTGVSIFSRSIDIHEGVNTVFLRSSEFPATGTYFVSIAGENAKATAKLIHLR
ncbi:MAG: hypothetical protein JNL32_13885 [Candidatus Kapabacteria bacterium]|nr:hypothetical protein [Candidatus Kapabacteria bacterium]